MNKEGTSGEYVDASAYLGAKIFLPGEFDRKVAIEPTFKAQIAGATVLPWNWFQRGLKTKGFSIELYGRDSDSGEGQYLNVNLHQDVFRKLSTNKILENFFELYQQDRDGMGFFTSAGDLYQIMVGKSLNQLDGFGELINTDLGAISEAYKKVHAQNIHMVLENVPNIDQIDMHLEHTKEDILAVIHEYFPSEKTFFNYLDLLKDRLGVQVVYGDRKSFLQYILSQKYKIIDDLGVQLYKPIPDRFVLAVLPLGTYDQQKLIRFRKG